VGLSYYLDDPPGENDQVADRAGGQQVPVALPEQRGGEPAELGLGPRLVHQVYVLVPSYPKQPEREGER
jgi:hypothetical protein